MKKLSIKLKHLISNIIHFTMYIAIFLVFIITCFAFYVKVYTIDVSFLIDYLKQEEIIDKNANVQKLALEFDKSFILSAKNVSLTNEFMDINLEEADIELARASILTGYPSIKKINIDNAEILINLDTIQTIDRSNYKPNKNTDSSILATNDINYHKALKQPAYIKILKLTKHASIANSTVTVIYNNEKQEFKNINILFNKTRNSLKFTAIGKYKVLDSIAPFSLEFKIDDLSDDIKIKLKTSDVNLSKVIDSVSDQGYFDITGLANINLEATLNKKNKLTDITGAAKLQNGFIKINNLYNNNLDFNEITADFNFDIKNKLISFSNAKLIDKKSNEFSIFGDFSYKNEMYLNVTALNNGIDLMQAFKYIPDLSFKKWTDENITTGYATNVKFGYYGPFRPIMDGINGNPYFDITAHFEDLTLTYLDNLPAITNGKGLFKMLKKDIDISIDSAKTSEQNIKRGSVKIAPLFEKDIFPAITIKSLSSGSIEDVLTVVDTKLQLNQNELFKHYKGTQETQTTIVLHLENLNNNENTGTDDQKFITVDVISDIPEIVGMDPIFKQRFEATDSTLIITEDDFKLDASGFMNESPFTISLKEKLLEFGQHTDITLHSNFDSFLIKEYLDIPSFNLSGIVDSSLKLNKKENSWFFDLNANVENSLINFGFLNYTKPFTKPGTISSKGSFNTQSNVLSLNNVKVDIDDFKANGSSLINLSDIQSSKADFKNIIIKDKTDISKFTLDNRLLTIKGKSLDLRPFTIKDDSTKVKNTNQTDNSNANKPKRSINKINIKLDRVYLNDDEGLVDASVLLNLTETVTGLVKLRDTKNSQSFYLKLTPVDDNTVKLESLMPNFGNALKKTKVNENINSGFGVLYGDLIFENNKFDSAKLKLSVKKYQVLKAPLLAKVLASLSLDQLFTKKKGILFDELYSEINYDDGILELKNAKAKGPSLGFMLNGVYDTKTKVTDMNGTLVPVVKLNSVLGNIPVLGYILTGSQGAISGADFKIYTEKGEDKVSVSPLSIVTPGIVKDLFSSVGNLIPGVNNDGSKIVQKAREKANIESKNTGDK